jgi:hypothetical protein
LALYQDTTIDQQLTSASQRNTFDEEIIAIIRTITQEYRTQLRLAINAASDDTQRTILDTADKNILTIESLALK